MSFIQASRDAILKPLMTVAGIVEKRHTLPILANVMMRKDAERVTFLASDVEIQISTTAELSRTADTAATTVSARKLIDILKALPDNIDVTIRVDDRKATLSAGRSRFTLQTCRLKTFPPLKPIMTGQLAFVSHKNSSATCFRWFTFPWRFRMFATT